MDMMMLLEGDALTKVYADFKAVFDTEGRGLLLIEFVSSFLRNVDHPSLDKVQLVKSLVDLFKQIDVNGDKSLEWSEFTSYCIEAGMAATAARFQKPDFQFCYDNKFVDKHIKATAVSDIRYHGVIDMVVCIESGVKGIKIFDNRLNLLRILDTSTSIKKNLRDVDTSVPLKHVLLPHCRMIAVLMSTTNVALWTFALRGFTYHGTLTRGESPHAANMLHYDPVSQTLLVGCANGTILVYDPVLRRLLHTLREHTDIMMAMASIPTRKQVISTALDRKVYIWDVDRMKKTRELIGHDAVVTKFTYVQKLDLLLGCSVKNEVFGWDMGTCDIVFTIRGHITRLVDTALVLTTPPRLLTMDQSGLCKLWEIAEHAGNTVPCLQSWRIDEISGFLPSHCVLISPSRLREEPMEIWMVEQMSEYSSGGGGAAAGGAGILAGPKEADPDAFPPGIVGDLIVTTPRMHRLPSLSIDLNEPPAAALYNPTLTCFVTAVGRDVSLWDADTGRQEEIFPDSAPSDISCACFDDRKRKLFLGRVDGVVQALNLQNGATMKVGEVHRGSVTAVLYNDADRCIISAASDGSLAVYDDEPQTELEDLRLVRNAHPVDITAMAYSYELSLIVTGDRNGGIRCWDFQDLKMVRKGRRGGEGEQGQWEGRGCRSGCAALLCKSPWLLSHICLLSYSFLSISLLLSPVCRWLTTKSTTPL